MTFLTLFTAPKPFTNPHINLIQRNALRAWQTLPETEVIVIGAEAGLAEAAAELGVRHLPDVQRNTHGTPLVSSLFDLARQHSSSPLLAYANADILLLPDFVTTLQQIARQTTNFLAVGQRRDLEITAPLDFAHGWQAALRSQILQRGKLCGLVCIDYFAFPRQHLAEIPPLAIGRAGWDNWMIYNARRQGLEVIDLTPAVVVGHQNHDYSHLGGFHTHHRMPESLENVRLGGGRRTIFSLADVTHQFVEGQRVPARRTWAKFWREVEIFPLLRLGSFPLANLFFAILHPRRAFIEWRPALSRLKRKLLGQPPLPENEAK